MRTARILTMAALFLMAASLPATATIVTFDYSFEFSGATPPAGPAPWLQATFNDFGGSGTVQLTMSASGLIGSEFVEEWYFNFSGNPTTLTFAAVNTTASVAVISTGTDLFKADGDGSYDISFNFPPPPGSFASKFTAGETVIYNILGTGITADSFNVLSAPASGGGPGPFYAAAHVQGIGPNGESGWVGCCQQVPEPSTLLLLGSGMIGAALMGTRIRR